MDNFNYDSNQPTYQAPEQPMGWHKFLCVILFVSAALNVFTGITAFTGGQYDGYEKLVYSLYPGLKTADMIMGVACIALAVYAVYTRMQLAAFKVNGPKLLLGLYAAAAAVNTLYLIIASSAVGDSVELDSTSTIIQIVVSAVMIYVNKVYYDKRQHMFTNQ